MRKIPQSTHGQLATPVSLDQRVEPPSDPTIELVFCAVSGRGKRPSWAASGSKPATGAVDLSEGAVIREDPGSAAGACYCQCRRRCCCFDVAPAFLRLVKFRSGSMIKYIFVIGLHPARDSRHIVGLGTNSYCLVIVQHAVMRLDRSIGTRQEAVSFVFLADPRVRLAERLHGNGSQLYSKNADPRARSAGLTRGSAENSSRVMMA